MIGPIWTYYDLRGKGWDALSLYKKETFIVGEQHTP